MSVLSFFLSVAALFPVPARWWPLGCPAGFLQALFLVCSAGTPWCGAALDVRCSLMCLCVSIVSSAVATCSSSLVPFRFVSALAVIVFRFLTRLFVSDERNGAWRVLLVKISSHVYARRNR